LQIVWMHYSMRLARVHLERSLTRALTQ